MVISFHDELTSDRGGTVVKAGNLSSVLNRILIMPARAFKLQMRSKLPLPPELATLPNIKAEPWVQVSNSPGIVLEGPAFDRQGNLFVTSVREGRVYKVTPTKKVTIIFEKKEIRVDGSAFHKDGRLFVCCLTGELIAMNPDGSEITYIESRYHGKPTTMNDLVFDANGNLYVSEFSGTAVEPIGGVYRFSSDFKIVEPVVENLAKVNGVALSPDGNTLWLNEEMKSLLLEVTLPPEGAYYLQARVRYNFAGGANDSMAVDIEGNIYIAIIFQGRVIILNKLGIPIANVLIPGRDEGEHLTTTNVAFKPDTCEAYVTAASTDAANGAWIYKFRGLATGLKLFSHQ